jgi:MAC/Perforin domain
MDNSKVGSKVGAAHVEKGREYLGKGVNIFAEGYLVPPNKGQVIDLTDGNVTTIPLDRSDVTEASGSNFAEFVQNFSVKAGVEGSYKGFTGSVESKFSKSSRDSIDIKFAQVELISSGAILTLGSDPVVLKRYLNSDFEKALAEADPKTLFAAYGTHVAVAVKVGGMLSYYAHSKTTEHQSETEFQLAAKLKYEGFGATVGANVELTEQQKQIAKTVEGSTHLFVNGGDAEARANVEGGVKGSYPKWAGTLGTSPGFIGFQEQGLFPVWKLTDDAARRAALELAFKQEAARQFQIRIFTHTGTVAAHPQARVHIPKEYKLLAGGAKDNYAGPGNLLTASFPDGDATWVARGKDHSDANPASVSVFALAIYDNLDLWEVAQFFATGDYASHPSAQVAIAEDFVGKGGVLVGGGARVEPGADKLLTASYPKNTTTWVANAADPINNSPGKVTVFAQGLRCKVEGVEIKTKTNQAQSQRKDHPSEKCSPNRGFALVGGGAFVDFEPGLGNLLISSYPENDHTWAANSKDHLKPSKATITAYAIGMEVS